MVGGTQYSHRPGFLNAFSDAEKNSILLTSIRVGLANNSYEDIQREVFLASVSEVGLNSSSDLKDGSLWDYFRSNSRGARLTDQAYLNTLASSKPADITKEWSWALRSFNVSDTMYVVLASETSKPLSHPINGNMGIRPAINLSSNLRISDTQDSDGCYTIVWNSAPNAPSLVTAPATVYGGKSNPISWSSVTDPDGDAVTYQLECSIDNGAYTEIYRGTATTYAHLVPFGATFVAYRVKATDPQGASGAYTVSATKTVVNNNAPVISGADGNLGVKSNGFTGTYTITDANSDAVTVTEAIDGVQIRALVATLGQAITYGVTENTWLALPNGSHTLTITATDGIDTSVRTYVFTKLVEGFTIQNATPWASSTRPSRIMLVITRNIPSGAKFKVEVCNNGLQGSPTWEDCTAAVESGLVHVFSNQSNSAASWGVIVRVTVARNGATGACYVSAIGGNWE